MTEHTLAEMIERRSETCDIAERAWRGDPTNDEIWESMNLAKCRLADVVQGNLPAILTALRRTHAEADVERVARAIYDSMFAPHERCWGEDPWLRDRYMDTARAALAALPRPEADEGAGS